MTSINLLDLCAELLQCILEKVEPDDLAALSRTCHALFNFIPKNKTLWKAVYTNTFGNPTKQLDAEPNWEYELKRLVILRRILDSEFMEYKRSNFNFAANMILQLADTGIHLDFLQETFRNKSNVDVFCSSSSLFREGGTEDQLVASTKRNRRLSAQINVMFGSGPVSPMKCPHLNELFLRPRHSENDIHAYARSRVYDLRRYTTENLWGPFTDDGTQAIDWEKVEAIQIDLGYNLSLFADSDQMPWASPFAGCAANSYKSTSYHAMEEPEDDFPLPFTQSMLSLSPTLPQLKKEASLALDTQDPYGVTGTWARVVCFLDYNDLFAFNFTAPQLPADQPREPISTQEAIRIIVIKLQVTKVEPPGPDDGQDLPVVHFKGTSRARSRVWDGNANSLIRGTVRQTPRGAIRWTTFSIFDGEARWRSEGVQVGGLKSARGVLGSWFDKDYDEFGPAGPTAFWKLSDDLDDPTETERAASPMCIQLPFGYL